MSTEVLDRHQAVQERIDRAKQIVAHAEEVYRALVFDGVSLADLDPDEHMLHAIRALLGVATRSDGFDVTVSLSPHSGEWGVRVCHIENGVEISAVPLLAAAAEAAAVDGAEHRQAEEPADDEETGVSRTVVHIRPSRYAEPEAPQHPGPAEPTAAATPSGGVEHDSTANVVTELADLLRG